MDNEERAMLLQTRDSTLRQELILQQFQRDVIEHKKDLLEHAKDIQLLKNDVQEIKAGHKRWKSIMTIVLTAFSFPAAAAIWDKAKDMFHGK